MLYKPLYPHQETIFQGEFLLINPYEIFSQFSVAEVGSPPARYIVTKVDSPREKGQTEDMIWFYLI